VAGQHDGDTTGEATGEYAESEIRTIALAIIGGVFFGGLATGVAFPTLPLLTDILGISAVVLGLILSANRVSRLVMNTPAGNLVDQIGTRRPMIAGLFVQALAPFGYVLGLYTPTGSFVAPIVGDVSYPAAVFIGARLMWGFGSAFVFIGAFATITHVTTQNNRGRWLGYMRAGQSLGFPSGLIVGGLIFNFFDAQTAFLTAGVLALVAGFVAASVLPDIHPDTDERARLRDIPDMIRREPRIFPLGIGNMTIRFIFGGLLLATVASYAKAEGMELSVLEAGGLSGIVLATGVLSSSVTTFLSGQISDDLDNRAVITIPAYISMATGLALVAMVSTLPALIAGVALVGVGTGGAGPALMAIVGDITPGEEIGRMGSVYNLMGDVGLVLGPLLAVPMAETWVGYSDTYYLCAGAVLVTLVVVAVPLLRYEVDAIDPDAA
jgi:MFS family permease